MIDKPLHFIAGAIITLLVVHFLDSIFLGLVLGAMAGLLKELWDIKHKGTPEFLDFLATLLGAIVAAVIMSTFN